MDHISDSFLETNVPLLVLIEAAKSGNEKEVKEYAQVFREHANKLVEVGHKLFIRTHAHALPHNKVFFYELLLKTQFLPNEGQQLCWIQSFVLVLWT